MAKALRVDPRDGVATLLADAPAGEIVSVGDTKIALTADIGRGHKVALAPIAAGDPVIRC